MRRLFFSIIVAVLGSLFLIGWGLDNLVANHSEQQESSDIVIYKQIIEGINTQLARTNEENLSSLVKRIATDFSYEINIESSQNIALPQTLHEQLSLAGGLLLVSDNRPYLLRQIEKHPKWLIQLYLPQEQLEDNSVNLLLTAILYLGVCAMLVLWLLPLARRLFLLTKAAAQIGKGELNIRVKNSRLSYISPLEKSFNHMAGQIENLMEDNKILARSLSHDIRTPMSCLRFGVEAALDSNNIEKKNIYLMRMEEELTRMEDMTSAFLAYAGMERQGINLKLENIDVNQFIEAIIEDFQGLAQQYNVLLSAQLPVEPAKYTFDHHWMSRALQNLITNAVQYAKSKVTLSIKFNQNAIEIHIEDDGKGIDEDKLEMVFKPFIKLDTARSREQGHFGLGLAITAKVVSWHQGKIIAGHAKDLSGAGFIIHLPSIKDSNN